MFLFTLFIFFWSVCFLPMHTLFHPTCTWEVSNWPSLAAWGFAGTQRLSMVTWKGGCLEDHSGVKEARPLEAEPFISLLRASVSNRWECKWAYWCSGRGQATLSSGDMSREDPCVHPIEAMWPYLHCILGFPLTIHIYCLILTTEACMYDKSVHRWMNSSLCSLCRAWGTFPRLPWPWMKLLEKTCLWTSC